MTGQGFNEDDIRRRDEEAKIDHAHCANATEKTTSGKHLCLE